jgi:hypothetical protein
MCAAFALASVAVTSGARAAAERFRFVYRAPEGCPDERTFVERVAARIESTRLASQSDTGASTMAVDVSVRDTESSGRLEFVDSSGETVARTVSGRSCDEIVSGLALIAALAIEARVTTEPAAPPPAAEPPMLHPRLDEALAARPRDPFPPPRFGAGVLAGIESSLPGAAFAAGLYGEVAWREPLRFARIGARRVASDASVGNRTASFTLWSARVDACPLSFVLAPRLELPACAAFELGQLSGAGRTSAALPDPESDRILWGKFEASAGVRWEPTRFWIIEARGAAGFPLTRHKFVFRWPTDTVYEIPAAGWGLAIHLGAHFS